MLKMVVLLDRTADSTFEEFVEYWETEHAPLVDDLPGVKKYAISLPTDPDRSAYDGMAELYFEDMDALGAAFETEAGKALQADLPRFAETGETLYVEETVLRDDTA